MTRNVTKNRLNVTKNRQINCKCNSRLLQLHLHVIISAYKQPRNTMLSERKQLVTIDNNISKARWLLESVNSHKLLLTFISKIINNTGKEEFEELEAGRLYTLNALDFSQFFELDKKHIFEVMKDIVDKLYEAEIILHPTDKKTIKFRWVSYIEYDGITKEIGLKWSPDVIPYISQLTGGFNTFPLAGVKKLHSVNSIRLYEIFSQFRNVKEKKVIYNVEELKYILGLEGKYTGYAQINGA